MNESQMFSLSNIYAIFSITGIVCFSVLSLILIVFFRKRLVNVNLILFLNLLFSLFNLSNPQFFSIGNNPGDYVIYLIPKIFRFIMVLIIYLHFFKISDKLNFIYGVITSIIIFILGIEIYYNYDNVVIDFTNYVINISNIFICVMCALHIINSFKKREKIIIKDIAVSIYFLGSISVLAIFSMIDSTIFSLTFRKENVYGIYIANYCIYFLILFLLPALLLYRVVLENKEISKIT